VSKVKLPVFWSALSLRSSVKMLCSLLGRFRESHCACIASYCPQEYEIDANGEDVYEFSFRSSIVCDSS